MRARAPGDERAGDELPIQLVAHFAQSNFQALEAIDPGGLVDQVVAFPAFELTYPIKREASSDTGWAQKPWSFTPEMDRREA